MSMQADRLFLVLDPKTRRVVDLCTGPGVTGDCPSYVVGQPLPCEGYRVIPLRRTSANGLPFLVGHCEGTRCPMAWIDGSQAEGGPAAGAGPDPEGWFPPEHHQGPGGMSLRHAS